MVNIAMRARALRSAIEAEMADSFAGALTLRAMPSRPLLAFGIAALDALTGGGVPAGAVTELVGAGSSGKTTAAMRLMAGAMQSGRMGAWVDASDSFDPETAEANGMLLPQLLWVRCGGTDGQAPRPSSTSRSVMLAEAAIDRAERVQPGRCSSHPRGEEQGLDQAVHGLFQSADMKATAWPDMSRMGKHSTRNRQKTGTPGAPNVPIAPPRGAESSPYRRAAFQPVPRHEQVASDRQGGRNLLHGMAAQAQHSAANEQPRQQVATSSAAGSGWVMPAADGPQQEAAQAAAGPNQHGGLLPGKRKPWASLDQALRAADLLLQGGGFSVLIVDLGSVAPEHALRIPAATWFRFRAVAEASGTACILLSQVPCARSSAALVLEFKPLRLELAGGTAVASVCYTAELARQRFSERAEPPSQSSFLKAAAPLVAGAGDRGPARKPPLATWQASHYPVEVPNTVSPPSPAPSTGKLRLLASKTREAEPKAVANQKPGVLPWKPAQEKQPGGINP